MLYFNGVFAIMMNGNDWTRTKRKEMVRVKEAIGYEMHALFT